MYLCTHKEISSDDSIYDGTKEAGLYPQADEDNGCQKLNDNNIFGIKDFAKRWMKGGVQQCK